MLERVPLHSEEPRPPPPPLAPPGDGPESRAVEALLRRARARQRRVVLGTAAAGCLAGALAALPVALAVAAGSPGAGRALVLALALGALAAFAVTGLLRARRQAGDLGAVARLLAGRFEPAPLRRGLVPAWELLRELRAGGPVPFSESLARAHLESVARAAPDADLARALPDRPLRWALGALLAALAAVALCLLAFPEPMRRGARLLVAAEARPAPPPAPVEPVTGEIALTYVYPAYTRLPSRTVPNTNGEISAPRGTQVQLATRADRDVARAFAVTPDGALALQVKDGRGLSGSLLVDKPGSYHFRFLDPDGEVLAEGPPIPISVEQDGAPKPEILAPAGDVEVDPDSRVALRFEAEDDFGLSEVALLFKLPGATKPGRIVLQRPPDAPRRASGEFAWDLASLGLMAGDRVAYYLEAVDGDEVSGRKTGVSRTQYLTLYSAAEHHRQAIKKVEEHWEKLVAQLADRLEGPDRQAGARDEALFAQAAVDERGRTLAAGLKELARDLRKDKGPEQLSRAVANVAAGLGERVAATSSARAALQGLAARGTRADGAYRRRLQSAVSSEIAEEERGILYLEALLDQQRIEDLVGLAKELSAKRRDLAGLLEKYRTAPDEATRDRLLAEVARLKERMGELLKRMAELSRGINDEHVNAEALAELGKSKDMMGSFDKLQELLHQGKVEEAMKEMERLGEQLEGLERGLQKASGEFKGGEFGELGKQLAGLAGELDALERDQQQLLEETQEVRGRYKQVLEQKLAAKGKDFVERLRKKVAAAREKAAGIESSRDLLGALKAAEGELSDLDLALGVKDFDQALQSTGRALGQLRPLGEELARQASDARRYPQAFKDHVGELERDAASARGAVGQLEEVSKELSDLFPAPSQAMTEQDRRRMKGLSEKEAGLQQRAGQLQQQMNELNGQAPIFSPEAQQMMQGASERMGRAQQQLSGRNPGGASAEQRAALDQLGQLKKGLQRQQSGGGGGAGQPIPWPWAGPSSGPGGSGEDGTQGADRDQQVAIPGADQYQVPEEYRKDILDAMKQGSPERYRDQVKRYYEEIVK